MSASLSIRFGRGKAPSSDLRHYLSEDDKWMLGSFLFDDQSMLMTIDQPGYATKWWGYPDSNRFALGYVGARRFSAVKAMESAWSRYLNPGEKEVQEPEEPEFRLQLATQGIQGRHESAGNVANGVTITISFGAARDLSQVDALVFASSVKIQASWHRSFFSSPIQPGLSFEVQGFIHRGGERINPWPAFAQDVRQFDLVSNQRLRLGDFDWGITYRPTPDSLARSRVRKGAKASLKPVFSAPDHYGLLVAWVEAPDGAYYRRESHVSRGSNPNGSDQLKWENNGFDGFSYGYNVERLGEVKADRLRAELSACLPGEQLLPGRYRVYLDFWPDRPLEFSMLNGDSYVYVNAVGVGSINARDTSRPASRVPVAEFDVLDLGNVSVSISSLPKWKLNSSITSLIEPYVDARAVVTNLLPVSLENVTVVVRGDFVLAGGGEFSFYTVNSSSFSIKQFETKSIPVDDITDMTTWVLPGVAIGVRAFFKVRMTYQPQPPLSAYSIETEWRPL